ncbi:hypothetical protein AC578_4721 [Pseudocercospora eumusae]|uniref:Uncharacterized protein n=1 Tax=Pseudocercospora eumusae TaxID=321146 RepID=A0A139GZ14_9PEZI|nr:hypothetical protein AC578_4721 [Pseudocercospora eumusae]
MTPNTKTTKRAIEAPTAARAFATIRLKPRDLRDCVIKGDQVENTANVETKCGHRRQCETVFHTKRRSIACENRLFGSSFSSRARSAALSQALKRM